jgi:uncharacterized membrane protein (Fun14 family)
MGFIVFSLLMLLFAIIGCYLKSISTIESNETIKVNWSELKKYYLEIGTINRSKHLNSITS